LIGITSAVHESRPSVHEFWKTVIGILVTRAKIASNFNQVNVIGWSEAERGDDLVAFNFEECYAALDQSTVISH
jgi:hypothetical protein